MQDQIPVENAASSDRKLAILGFHKVGEPSAGGWETWYYVPESDFADTLSCLRENDWEVIDLAALLRGIADPASLPPRAALLTFDDGYLSVLEVALPVLLQFGFPAVIFVPTDCVGMGSHSFDANSREPDEPLCGWDELRELERHGVAVQSHGVTHRALSALGFADQEKEIVRSKAVIETELNRPVEMFSYPYGDNGANPAQVAETLRRAGYKAACLYDGFLATLPITDPYNLSRLYIGRGSDVRAELGDA